MNAKVDEELQNQIRASLAAGVSDEGMERIKKQVETIRCDIEEDVMYRLKDDLAPNLTAWVADMAQKAVEQLLEGNEDQMRRYLSCDGHYDGRSGAHNMFPRPVVEQHPIIHGELFEQGCVKLRRDIVNAHRDLLVNERILDLEDQVKSLVAQVNKANAEREKMWDRVRACGG